jgi:hypothetical protein
MNLVGIIQKCINHDATETTPYSISFESKLYNNYTEYFEDENWEGKKLRKFI